MTQPESLLGYDRDRFVSPVDDEFICAICLGVLRKPVQLPCEHMFCESCIERWNFDNPACPNCRRFVNELENCNPPSRALLSLLNKLSLRCQFTGEGCRELLNLTNVEQHELKCDFRPAACPLKGCGKMVPQNGLARHITECERRSQVCETCELSLRNGESHSKDDCIAALKRALRDCVTVIIQKNSTASSSSVPEPRPPTPPRPAANFRPPSPYLALHFQLNLPSPNYGRELNRAISNDSHDDDTVGPRYDAVDLTADDGDVDPPSVIAPSGGRFPDFHEEEDQEDDESDDDSESSESGNSAASVVGTPSNNTSWHSGQQVTAGDPNSSTNAGAVEILDDEFSLPSHSIYSPTSPPDLVTEPEDDNEETYPNSMYDTSDESDNESGRPKRPRHSSL